MKNLFNSIKLFKPSKSVFDLSHDVKFSCNLGQLVPIMMTECVPGDKIKLSCESLIRFAPMVAPVMHRFDVSMHYFFVPNRILWPNWENFITQTKVNGEIPVMPYTETNNGFYTKLLDYMGIPRCPVGGTAAAINLLPFAAYQRVFNDYYRDQNLMPDLMAPDVDPADAINLNDGFTAFNLQQELFKLRYRCWEHDYFTASLPWAQKGEAVSIPFVGAEDVPVQKGGLPTTLTGSTVNVDVDADATIPDDGHMYAKTSELQSQTSINDLRRAYRLQEWLEKMARGGSRYIETIKNHFGVFSSDKRLQRPEYITGSKSPVQVSEVLNTTGTDDLPQGNMAGHGIAANTGKFGSYYCEEHGYVVGIMSIMPKTAYQQGIPKHFLKRDTYDFYWPSFANIGEQPVQLQELYAFTPGFDTTFGYVPRYAEYKFENSRVAGEFRTSLDFWHGGRILGTTPSLNAAFVQYQDGSTDRIFANVDPDVDHLYCHVLNRVQAIRPMPKFGTPTF